MLEKEQWMALIAGDECRSDSLGDEDAVNDLEQERWVRFATSWMCSQGVEYLTARVDVNGLLLGP